MILDEAKHAVITVGAGRGFVVDSKRGRLVITAAHCLPRFPRRASVSHSAERTYNALLGPLGKEPSVSTECLFADPIGDIAVLGGRTQRSAPLDGSFRSMADGIAAKCATTMVPCGYSTLERGS